MEIDPEIHLIVDNGEPVVARVDSKSKKIVSKFGRQSEIVGMFLTSGFRISKVPDGVVILSKDMSKARYEFDDATHEWKQLGRSAVTPNSDEARVAGAFDLPRGCQFHRVPLRLDRRNRFVGSQFDSSKYYMPNVVLGANGSVVLNESEEIAFSSAEVISGLPLGKSFRVWVWKEDSKRRVVVLDEEHDHRFLFECSESRNKHRWEQVYVVVQELRPIPFIAKHSFGFGILLVPFGLLLLGYGCFAYSTHSPLRFLMWVSLTAYESLRLKTSPDVPVDFLPLIYSLLFSLGAGLLLNAKRFWNWWHRKPNVFTTTAGQAKGNMKIGPFTFLKGGFAIVDGKRRSFGQIPHTSSDGYQIESLSPEVATIDFGNTQGIISVDNDDGGPTFQAHSFKGTVKTPYLAKSPYCRFEPNREEGSSFAIETRLNVGWINKDIFERPNVSYLMEKSVVDGVVLIFNGNVHIFDEAIGVNQSIAQTEIGGFFLTKIKTPNCLRIVSKDGSYNCFLFFNSFRLGLVEAKKHWTRKYLQGNNR